MRAPADRDVAVWLTKRSMAPFHRTRAFPAASVRTPEAPFHGEEHSLQRLGVGIQRLQAAIYQSERHRQRSIPDLPPGSEPRTHLEHPGGLDPASGEIVRRGRSQREAAHADPGFDPECKAAIARSRPSRRRGPVRLPLRCRIRPRDAVLPGTPASACPPSAPRPDKLRSAPRVARSRPEARSPTKRR